MPDTQQAGTEAPAAKKKSKTTLVIAAGAAVVVVAGGGAALWAMRRQPAPSAAQSAPAAASEKPVGESGGVIALEPFVVNLADADARRYLRINVRLIVGQPETAERIQKNEVLVARLRSDILDQLTQQTAGVVTTPDGKTALKKTIATRAASIIAPTEVADVLFSDFVVQ